MEQHHGPDRLAVGFHDVGSVPVLGEARRIDRTVLEVAVDRHPLVRSKLLADLGANAVENSGLLGLVARPVGRVELALAQFSRHEGVPGMEGWAAEGPIGPQREQGHADHHAPDQNPPQ